MRSIVRWAGSKYQLLGQLANYWPKDALRYVEPFAGSASLFFAMQPRSALLSDLNAELIDAYQALRAHPTRVINSYRALPRGKTAYYQIRRQARSSLGAIAQAARFFYLNRYCFNGLYRTNLKGQFNVPYGPPKQPLHDFDVRLFQASVALRHAAMVCQDFSVTLDEVRSGDFVFLDPPYAVDERRVFREYLPGSFTTLDLQRLAASLRDIDARGAVFLLSYAVSKEARELSRHWFTKRVLTRRHVAGFASDRRCAQELLVSNRPL